jgi:hypothetical protein
LEATELPEITDPRLRLLHDLWQIYRDDAPAPRRADLDVFDSPLWLGHLSLLEAIENGVDFRYLIYGRVKPQGGRKPRALTGAACRDDADRWAGIGALRFPGDLVQPRPGHSRAAR